MSLADINLHDAIVLSGTAWVGSLAGWAVAVFWVQERKEELPVTSPVACFAAVAEISEASNRSPLLIGFAAGCALVVLLAVCACCWARLCCSVSEPPRHFQRKVIRGRK